MNNMLSRLSKVVLGESFGSENDEWDYACSERVDTARMPPQEHRWSSSVDPHPQTRPGTVMSSLTSPHPSERTIRPPPPPARTRFANTQPFKALRVG